MNDMLQVGLDWLEAQRREHLSRTVTYRRGFSSVDVPATVGATPFQADDGSGAVIEQEIRDYLVAAADLVLDGVQVQPERGDEIVDAARVYAVMDLGPEPHYRTADPSGRTVRIHTKLVRTEPG